MTTSRRLHLIAFKVRRELEAQRTQPKWEKRFGYKVHSDLGGLCGVASDRIVTLAERAGIPNVSAIPSEDGGHVFVHWASRKGLYIIDVTVTQFNNRRPKVCMLLRSSMTRVPHYWKEYHE